MEMTSVMSLLVIIGLTLVAAFYQLAVVYWTVLIGFALLVLTAFGYVTFLVGTFVWLIYLTAALFANMHQWRIRYVVQPLLTNLQKQLPSISSTEKAAIEAGDTWWEKELFCGRPNWNKLFDIPRPTLTLEEQNFLNNQVNHLCSLINDWDIIHKDRDLSNTVWEYLKKEKFFAMVIPKEYGGLGFSALAHSTVVTKIASRSISAAVTTMVPNSLGPGELLLRYGTDEQKKYYLPRLASSIDIPCFALTAPEAGSDAGAIPDVGIVCRGLHEGKETLGIKLSWDKRYITLAPVATLLGLAIHLYDPNHLLGDKTDVGITLCLIPTSHPGVEVGSRHIPMYMAFMNGPTRGKNVFIPIDWIIGGTEMAGNGWRMLMECLSIGRSISLPALSTACGKMAYRVTGAYARVRRQFNMPLSSFEGIEEALGDIAGFAYMLEACRMMTAGAVDQAINPAIVSAIAKYHMTEMSRHVISKSMDVHGGQMIQVGPRNIFANAYISLPISITVEGANILTRNLIIFGQGAIRCHPYLLQEIELISANNPDIQALDRVLMSHIGFYVSNLLRNIAYGFSGGLCIFSNIKNRRIKKQVKQLTRMSAALALLADTSLILLGGSLKRRERISARLGDIMSNLYLASTVLKYYHDHNKPQSDVDNVCWALQYCLYRIQVACDELLHNYPNKWVGKLLRIIIFPFGTAYRHPRDKLHSHIVEHMLAPSELRDRITRFCYIGENDLAAKLDAAIANVSTIDPIYKKIQKNSHSSSLRQVFDFSERVQVAQQAGIVSSEEATLLNNFEKLKNDIIQVNEFSFNLSELIA